MTLQAGTYFVFVKANVILQSLTSGPATAFCRMATPEGIGSDAFSPHLGNSPGTTANLHVPLRLFGHFQLDEPTQIRLECSASSGLAQVQAQGWNALPVDSLFVFN